MAKNWWFTCLQFFSSSVSHKEAVFKKRSVPQDFTEKLLVQAMTRSSVPFATPISRSCHQILVDTSSDKEELANFCHGNELFCSQLLALFPQLFFSASSQKFFPINTRPSCKKGTHNKLTLHFYYYTYGKFPLVLETSDTLSNSSRLGLWLLSGEKK